MIKDIIVAPRVEGLNPKELNQNQKIDSNQQDFLKILNQEIGVTPQSVPIKHEGVKFSNHAIDRIQTRNIQFQKDDMKRLNDAVDKAAEKGSREALILMGDNAFVVSVKNKTVITALDKTLMKENVFTNIDSTIVL